GRHIAAHRRMRQQSTIRVAQPGCTECTIGQFSPCRRKSRTVTCATRARFHTFNSGASLPQARSTDTPCTPQVGGRFGRDKERRTMLTLREARQQRHLSQQALADRAGVARVTVSQIELGKSGPRPHVARRLSEALGMDPSEIVEFAEAARMMALPRPTIFALEEIQGDEGSPVE